MKGLSREFCGKIAQARREAGISQTELATEIGCKQSALSPFERGDGTKLSDEAIQKLSVKFGIPLPVREKETEAGGYYFPITQTSFAPGSGFCPNPDCPSHRKVTVAERTMIVPERRLSDPVGGRFCAYCGEVLERKCTNCGAPVHDGAVCSHCGRPYVA